MNKYISDTNDLSIERYKLNTRFKDDHFFPENVFIDEFRYFTTFEFDLIFSSFFYEGISKYINKIKDPNFTIYSVDPTPDYYLYYIKKYGVGICSAKDGYTNFSDFLSYDPDDKNLPFYILAEDIAVFSDNDQWGIYGSRGWEIGFVGFKNIKNRNLFLDSFEDADDIFYSLDENVKELREMLKFSEKAEENYSNLLKNYPEA